MKLFLLAFLVFSSVTAFGHELKMAVITSEFSIIGIKEILTSWSDTENLSNFEKTTHHELF